MSKIFLRTAVPLASFSGAGVLLAACSRSSFKAHHYRDAAIRIRIREWRTKKGTWTSTSDLSPPAPEIPPPPATPPPTLTLSNRYSTLLPSRNPNFFLCLILSSSFIKFRVWFEFDRLGSKNLRDLQIRGVGGFGCSSLYFDRQGVPASDLGLAPVADLQWAALVGRFFLFFFFSFFG